MAIRKPVDVMTITYYLMAVALGVISFIPLGIFLQWYLPSDGAAACVVPPISMLLLCVAIALHALVTRFAPHSRYRSLRVARFVTTFFLVLFAGIAITVFLPPLSRRVGPWVELRSLLIQKANEVDQMRANLGIPADRYLTTQEIKNIEATLMTPYPEYTFPLIGKTVKIRIMKAIPPHVGVDYGEGRNAVFDLDTMLCIYAD